MSGILAIIAAAGGGSPGVINGALPNGSAAASTATWQLNNDGSYTIDGQAAGNWVTPASAAIAAQYQVKTEVTLNAFILDPSAGSYIDMSSTRAWTVDSAGDPESVTFDVTFREKATGIVRSVQIGVTLSADL